MKKIALEEHISLPEYMQLRFTTPRGKLKPFPLNPEEMKHKLPAMCGVEQRLKEMEENEIAMQFLMSGTNGFDFIDDADEAVRKTTAFNDYLRSTVQRYPDKFRAFGSLPMVSPEAMAEEARRLSSMKEFAGANISGVRLDNDYIDDERYNPFWEAVNEISADGRFYLYLHPCETPDNILALYRGCEVLNGSTWSWGSDTAAFLLRMVFTGLFDRYPNVRIILGHLGEMLPYTLDRVDARWKISPLDSRNSRKPSSYFKTNVYITTSGNASVPALKCAIDVMGADRILFAVDYPFEENREYAEFIENADISEKDREMICYKNAERLFGL
ncbi:MAG: amidohydrolase [Erysipelotrichaceae bacterium]|nr:amidohydrolase [Erysipelotrichaceae bacterium]